MKQLFLAALLFASALPVAHAQRWTTHATDIPNITTTNFTVDVSDASSVSLQVSLAGALDHGINLKIGFTNNPSNGQTFGIFAGTNWNVWTWRDVVLTSVTNYSTPATNVSLVFTNGTAVGDMVQVVLNSNTNTFLGTNTPTFATDFYTNTTSYGAASNFWLAVNAFYNVTFTNSTLTFKGAPGDVWAVYNSAGTADTTNALVSYYTVTNVVATNYLHLQTTNSAAAACTNLSAALLTYYSNYLVQAYSSSTLLALTNVGNYGLAWTNGPGAMTNSLSTNAINGFLLFTFSNSVNQTTWFPDATKNFTLAYSSTNLTGCLSNWSSFVPPYLRCTVSNSWTNCAVPATFKVESWVKRGF